jgi:hypothetical protein
MNCSTVNFDFELSHSTKRWISGITGTILFNITDDGETLDILYTGEYPDVLGTFGVNGSYADKGSRLEELCPILVNPVLPKESCATRINASFASNATSFIPGTALCDPMRDSWSNTTARSRLCNVGRLWSSAIVKEVFIVLSVVLISIILGFRTLLL